MAGKSNKGRNKKASQTIHPESNASSDSLTNHDANGPESCISNSNGVLAASEACVSQLDTNAKTSDSDLQGKQGELRLYPVSVKTQSGEKLKLQLNPGDSVMDVRQFLLDAPETCFCTCYDLLLHENDGSVHPLEDYYEISEVADITSGSCYLEMVPALYDDRSIRAHVYRTRELLSSSNFHLSLSTYLALQQETTHAATTKTKTGVKTELPELDGLGFMENVTSCLSNLLASSTIEIKCLESIVFSSFNPPPSYRRLVGDLIYLDVVTLENTKLCITGTTKMFYVNSSTENTLDPMPCKTTSEADTLIGLFQKNSSKFRKAFREILERKASAHPFENVHSMLPPNSWLGMYPQPDHKRDTARAENALTLSYGSELIGMQRDWNEELQSCWEFPHTTPQERILRDRALYKVTCDFVDAAVTGAVGVVSRCIPPINPTDPECFHMHVHNNIFFSFAVDADVEELSKKHSSDINKRIASSSPVDGLSGKTSNNGTGGVPNGGLGMEEHSSVTSAEVQLADNEQATYASANNDLKGTKAYQEADVPGLYNLAMAIVDYRGYRVVAQSILPGILQGDKSDSLLYGSVDNGKKICWNENFHAKVLEAAKRLHLKEHAVLDDSGNVFKLAAPVECKGIVGSDERHYILDLMRVTPRDANYMGAGARFCILRPELITTFCRAKDVDRLKQKVNSGERVHDVSGILDCGNIKEMETKEDILPVLSDTSEINEDMHGLECGPSSDGNTEFCEDILFNPNVFTDIKLSGNPQEIAADEEGVRKASSYLSEIVLPKFIQDLCNLEMSPMDGETLTEALHASGINVRYVGKVANGTKHLPHLWDLCINEIVVRSAKHILKDVLRDTEDHNIGPAISHFFNCFFGNCKASVQNSTNGTLYRTHKKDNSSHHFHGNSRRQVKSKSGFSAEKNHSTYMNLSSERLWSDIVELAMLKYQLELPEDAKFRVKKIAVIRNLCQKVGITVAARKFDLDAEKPFQTLDILNLQPVIKHSVPCCSEAKELLDAGKTQMAEGMLSESYTLFSEAFSILQQVTGPMHRDVASCCRYLAMVLYHAGDMGGAIMQQHKELIINERCLGLDHPDTAHSYGNMALFYHGLNQTELALRYMSRALLLLSLSSGPDHPDVAATFINVAMMYQDMGKMQTALRYLQEALNTNEKLLGKDHIQTAVCYHALAIAFNCMRAYKLSHQHEKKTYDILVNQLGSEDARTRDSETWLNTFKMRELQLNAQKQKGQALDAASTQKAIDILKANPDLIHAFQAASTGSGSTNKSLNSAVMGETTLPPRGGRGVDERATRAAAEARKKAIARGVLIRPPHAGVSVHHPQPMTQLFNIINNSSGVALKQPESGESVEETPVGLGRGFASLDVKKVKAKDGPKKSD